MKVPHAWEDLTEVERGRMADELLARRGATDAQKQDAATRAWALGTCRFMLEDDRRRYTTRPKENA